MTIDLNGDKDFIFQLFLVKKNVDFEELKNFKNTDNLLLNFLGFANFMYSFIYSFFFSFSKYFQAPLCAGFCLEFQGQNEISGIRSH